MDPSSGQVTLKDKGETTITVVSGDKQTAIYTIAMPNSIVSVNSSGRVDYNTANNICKNIKGSLPSSIKELKDLYDDWGAANKYQHYSQESITAWTLQTSKNKVQGVASTYDLVRENPLIDKVNIAGNYAYAVCVR